MTSPSARSPTPPGSTVSRGSRRWRHERGQGAGLPGRLLVNSRTAEQAAALAADLDDMRTALRLPVHPLTCQPADLMDCDAVVIAVRATFTNTRATDVRMGGAAANAPHIALLGAVLRGYTGTVLVVTNPVDLMARLFADSSGCGRVYGIGSNLDTARYRTALAALLGVPARAVRGHVIGEHGDGMVVCASATTVNHEPIAVPVQQLRDELASRAGRISAGIGRTRSGPAGAVVSTLRLSLGLADGVTELSAAYRGGWLGIPLRFTAGRPLPCLPSLDADETVRFDAADTKLRTAYIALRPSPTPTHR
ncbi:Rossmann-fold NAD(P)-binding domain-containing protein [Actinacidiphila oryziradicis]|uniref:Lactate dehydrogenase n=1 Tax=Actinacidiphila oryziradicis TaxID=2571141 RepID=A0A4U0SRV6_9ACTN|nr:lactate dehydrogenase [Actinacidiphila oryziradicis]TKA12073.1 lactate dehydrogenase [Actinacidiphila oryziradicis]